MSILGIGRLRGDFEMAKKKDTFDTGENSTVLEPVDRELERLINEIEFTGSAIEMLNLKNRILFYLRKLQENN